MELGIRFGDEINVDPSSWDDVPDEDVYLCLQLQKAREFLVGIKVILEVYRDIEILLNKNTAVTNVILDEVQDMFNEMKKGERYEKIILIYRRPRTPSLTVL